MRIIERSDEVIMLAAVSLFLSASYGGVLLAAQISLLAAGFIVLLSICFIDGILLLGVPEDIDEED